MVPANTAGMVDVALAAYEQRNLRNVTIARTVTFVVILAWLALNYGLAVALENVGVICLFIALSLAAFALHRDRPDRAWVPYLFVVLDAILLAYTLLAPGRTHPDDWPWQMVLRHPSFLYFLILLALATLTFRPPLVLWAGLVIGLTWAAGVALIALRTDALPSWQVDFLRPTAELLPIYLDPRYVHVDDAVVRIFITILLSVILALAARRARALIYEQAEAARQRANLARYVAPSMVERLAGLDGPMAAARTQDAAVLFADIKGFTPLAERLGPEGTMELLRGFHGRMAELVFAHAGTLDKFIGDGLMATFGTPETAADDAARALACGRAMRAAVREWNDERIRQGHAPLRVGIGIDYGEVTTGDIGGRDRFEFAVIGDTVNVASRLEEATGELGRPLLLSDRCLRAAEAAGVSPGDLECLGPVRLRGRSEPLVVWAEPAAGTAR